MGKIKMGGSAVMEFEPDYCEFHITVSIQKDTSSEALSRGRQRVEEILQLLTEKAGLKIGDIILESERNDFSSYSDEKYYTYKKYFYFTYKADNKTTDTITHLLENVENTEYNLSFKFEDENEKEQLVIMKAVENSKSKAEQITNALGTKIIGFKEVVSEFNGQDYLLNDKNDIFCDSMSIFQSEKKSLASQISNPKIPISKSVDVIWLTE